MKKHIHCSECGTPLKPSQVFYEDSGSAFAYGVKLCKYCTKNTMVDTNFNDEEVNHNPFLDYDSNDYE